MKKLYPVMAIIALAAASQADWLLSKYEYPTTDSLTSAKLYGFQPFLNQASKGLVTVPGGFVRFAATLASDPSTAPKSDGYSANVGLLHPLTADWAERDLTGLTGVSFEFRNTKALTADGLDVAFGSSSYNPAHADSGQIYSFPYTDDLTPSPTDEWKSVKITLADFAVPGWWKKPAGYPKIDSILKKVKNLQIAPKTLYKVGSSGTQNKAGGVVAKCTDCVGPTMPEQTIEVRNLVLEGVTKYKIPGDTSKTGACADAKSILFDDFFDGNTTPKSKGGAFWYAYKDSGAADTTLAKATSTAVGAVVAGDAETPYGFFTLAAKLNKKSPAGVWQDYAGWGDIGVDFRGQGMADLTGIKAFQFTVGDMGTNTNLVETITFKLAIDGIPDADVYSVELPFDKIPKAGRTFCIRPTDLKQPSYAKVIAPLDLTKILRMSWETKITNNNNKAIDTATAKIFLTNVKFFGIDGYKVDGDTVVTGVKSRIQAIQFGASYANGNLSISGYQAVDAFDVVSIDGKKVTSFAPAANVALDLPRGSYFLVAKRGVTTTAMKIAVVGK